ncbi:uncharacterized protein Z519_01826 [Cladophialophora bantiana CBS 173.52]|uniref:Major facilitator superfamily (MFS) profile domain-containing protein n=1 Tax=Cladophialophora bantiana (strain ATCC 10958 / CBS 173.52 / CDC B-1940 / NIH 8579) TaxID=1442370 RepID=A0A0D2GIN0_CLAB1|nr:uncharacterized protein Z519_01826 [Cladophialophora bantiana CBS 173.52]KIW98242.1 hypothetical protein Z519_01826 [Cladophialophora bantiana CBS 173.52]
MADKDGVACIEEQAVASKAHNGHDSKELDERLEELVRTEVSHIELTPEEKKRVIRKLDLWIVPQVTFFYLLAYLDRGNIGNAKIAGMQTDLNLMGIKYNVVVMVFFIPYGLLEVPSNIVLKMVRPSLWISFLIVAWGIVMTLMSQVQSYGGLIAARFFLGVAEAGLFPGISYFLTIWYERYQVQTRFAVFYAGASLAGAFSGLLAFAIQHMDGVAGLAGWRWIFLLEGLFTVVCGLIAAFTIPDSPQRAKFLEEDEKKFVVSNLQMQTGSGQGRVTNDEKIDRKYIIAAFKEYKLWLGCLMWLGNGIPVYGFTYTAPTVVVQLGYTTTKAQLMVVPIYVCATAVTVLVALASDRVKQRSPFVIGGFLLGACGFLALIIIPHPKYPGVTYGFLFVAASGIFCPIMPALGWFANNMAPSSKRAVGMAILLTVGNLVGGLFGSNIYLESTKPRYFPGYGISFAIMLTAAALAFALRILYQRENTRRDSMDPDEIREKYSEGELLDMGDKSPFFRYTL